MHLHSFYSFYDPALCSATPEFQFRRFQNFNLGKFVKWNLKLGHVDSIFIFPFVLHWMCIAEALNVVIQRCILRLFYTIVFHWWPLAILNIRQTTHGDTFATTILTDISFDVVFYQYAHTHMKNIKYPITIKIILDSGFAFWEYVWHFYQIVRIRIYREM